MSAAGAGAGGHESTGPGRPGLSLQTVCACMCVRVRARVLTAHVLKWGLSGRAVVRGQGRQGGRRLARHAAPPPAGSCGCVDGGSPEPALTLLVVHTAVCLHSQEVVAENPQWFADVGGQDKEKAAGRACGCRQPGARAGGGCLPCQPVLPAALGGRGGGACRCRRGWGHGFSQGHECMLGVELPSQALPAGCLGCKANLALSGHLLVQCPWLQDLESFIFYHHYLKFTEIQVLLSVASLALETSQ